MTLPDALLLVSFGGPESADEVMPFLRKVVHGRGIPDARLASVAEHYHHLGGRSPLPEACRRLAGALGAVTGLPVYQGNLHWSPLMADGVAAMAADGVRSAAAFVTSGFGSPAGCRRYADAIAAAVDAVDGAPEITRLPLHFDHPGFLTAMSENTATALEQAPDARLVFSAHSLPHSMVPACPYVEQLRHACGAVAAAVGRSDYDLVWQSRSGPPHQPWLEPDVCDHIAALGADGVADVVLVPIGFPIDNVEVIWDLDHEAKDAAERAGVRLVRAETAGTHPAFIQGIVDQLSAADRAPIRIGEQCCSRS